MTEFNDKTMPLTEHLTEFRKRVIISFGFFIATVLLGFLAAIPVIEWLKVQPSAEGLDWHTFALGDALGVYMKIAFMIGFTISLPFLLYQIWAFVRPGLREDEQKATFRFIPFATILFIAGLAFGYYIIFPAIMRFMLYMTEMIGVTPVFGIHQYFSFLLNILIPIALFFEMPVIVMFLTRIRVLNPIRLRKMRKVTYMVLIILATMVTPPEFVSALLVWILLISLYELSVWISAGIYKKQLEEDQKLASQFEQG